MDDLDKQLSTKKALLVSSLSDFYAKEKPSNNDLINCMTIGNDYFNEAERLISDSKIQGKHNDGLWVTDRAESCESILETYLLYIDFLKTQSEKFNFPYQPPSLHACSSMQRMVKMYCKKKSSNSLRERFLKADLPTKGFDVKHRDDIEPSNHYITLIIGGVLIALSFFSAMLIDNPSALKVFMIRGLFAVGCSACSSFIPGWLNINLNGYLKAGGAIGVLLIFYFFNPPAMIIN